MFRRKKYGRNYRPITSRNPPVNIKSIRKDVLNNKPKLKSPSMYMNLTLFKLELEMLQRNDFRRALGHRLTNITYSIAIVHMFSNMAIMWEMLFDGKLMGPV